MDIFMPVMDAADPTRGATFHVFTRPASVVVPGAWPPVAAR